MKNLIFLGIVCFCVALAQPAEAQDVTLNRTTTDTYTLGDFDIWANIQGSGSGTIEQILSFAADTTSVMSYDGALAGSTSPDPLTGIPGSSIPVENDSSHTPGTTLTDIYTYLASAGITSTTYLVFGLDSNEPGSKTQEFLDVQYLQVELPSYMGSSGIFDLDGGSLRIAENIGSGSGTADALFRIDLGYDFMAAYRNGFGGTLPADGFKLSAIHANAENGFEEYFMDSAFYGPVPPPNAIPEPATMALFGLGLGGLGLLRRKQQV